MFVLPNKAGANLDRLQSLKGKKVEVDFHGSTYRGILTDVSEEEIFLQTSEQWLSLPLYEIGDIRPMEGK
ncbi:MAG: hypothetical protein AAB300_02750 [Nitrospirota bacterium]